jgi:hypothetical protein
MSWCRHDVVERGPSGLRPWNNRRLVASSQNAGPRRRRPGPGAGSPALPVPAPPVPAVVVGYRAPGCRARGGRGRACRAGARSTARSPLPPWSRRWCRADPPESMPRKYAVISNEQVRSSESSNIAFRPSFVRHCQASPRSAAHENTNPLGLHFREPKPARVRATSSPRNLSLPTEKI